MPLYIPSGKSIYTIDNNENINGTGAPWPTTPSGTNNIAIGGEALAEVEAGDNNIAIGVRAGDHLGIGYNDNDNIAIGTDALAGQRNSPTSNNIAIGTGAGVGTNFKDSEIAIGSNSGIINGHYSVCVGPSSGSGGATHTMNEVTAVGYQVWASGGQSVGVGSGSRVGEKGTALGTSANSKDRSVTVGNFAGSSQYLERSVAVGFEAGSNSRADDVVVVGYQANIGTYNVPSDNAVLIGNNSAGYGEQFVSLGNNAKVGAFNNVVNEAVAVGHLSNVTGDGGIAVGHSAASLGTDNVSIGHGANKGTSSFTSVAVGAQTRVGGSVDGTDPHFFSTVVGAQSQAKGTDNVAIGANAKAGEFTDANDDKIGTTVTNTTVVGAGASSLFPNAVVVGAGATGGANNSVALGTNATANALAVAVGDNVSTATNGVAVGRAAVAGPRGITIGGNGGANLEASVIIGYRNSSRPRKTAALSSLLISAGGADPQNSPYSISAITNVDAQNLARGEWLVGGIDDRGYGLIQAVPFGPEMPMNEAALVAGSATVALPSIKTGDRIFLTNCAPLGDVGALYVASITDGVGFTINSTSATDTSTVTFEVKRPIAVTVPPVTFAAEGEFGEPEYI